MSSNIVRLMIIGIVLMLPHNLLAGQTREILPDGEMEVFISLNELSRIKVIDDRIRSLKAGQGELEILEEGQLGEVYIKPARASNAPISIFIVTEKNHTYKLLMLPKKMPSEQIFIKHREERAKKEIERIAAVEVRDLQKDQIIDLIDTMIKGKKSKKFEKDTVEAEVEIQGRTYQQIAKYWGSDITGQHLEFKNTTSKEISLSHKLFNSDEDGEVMAIFIDQENLNPGEKASIFIIREAEDVE